MTSLSANKAELQTNLVKNGVLWSLLLFLFEYDYTLDESGVSTDEKSNQQKSANNLARMSILAIVALCGFELKLVLEENDALNAAIRYNTATAPVRSASVSENSVKEPSAQSSPSTTSAYTSNATNLIQNNAIHAIQMNSKTRRPAEKISDGEEVFEAEHGAIVEKDNFANNRKYSISGTASNSFIKKIIDHLLTKYISDKLSTHDDSEVLKVLTSNTRNPYIIWDNATRTQLIDFLDGQRTKSVKQKYEDITEIYDIVTQFSFDAHR